MLKCPVTRINMNFNKNRGSLIEVHIADIHFGVIDPITQYNILIEQFLNKIKDINFNILSIDGDLFDHKFQANSDSVLYAELFINDCVNLCKMKNATLVLLHGTSSHDSNQLKLFYHYLSDPTIDIRIIENTRFETIQGKKVLCIPEEYNKGKEYYENFLFNSGLYDGVFMHGTLKGSIYGANEINLSSKKNPTFGIESFCNCRGPIISGHVHVAGCFESHMYYPGSPIRWKFGEEEEKGFLVVLHDLDSKRYYVHFEEIKSFRYDTINLDHILADPQQVISYVDTLKKSGVDFIRLKFTIDKEECLNIIKHYFQKDPNVKILETYKQEKEKEAMQEVLSVKYSGYDYILDDNLSAEDKLTKYINQEMGYTYITVDELKKIIYDVL